MRAHPPSGRWKWSKRGGNWRDGKMFSNFLVVVRREALCLAFMSYKHTHDVQDGRNAPSLVAGEMTHWSVTLSIKLFISFRNKFHFCFILCPSRGTSIMISYFPVTSGNSDRNSLIECYFNTSNLEYEEIAHFLLLVHGIQLSIRHLKRVLFSKRLCRRRNHSQSRISE